MMKKKLEQIMFETAKAAVAEGYEVVAGPLHIEESDYETSYMEGFEMWHSDGNYVIIERNYHEEEVGAGWWEYSFWSAHEDGFVEITARKFYQKMTAALEGVE